MSTLLKIENLAIGFKKILFENINADVMPGTITALMGVNGVGKSCFLKTLGHLIPKLGGSILLNEKDYHDYTPLEFAQSVSLVLTEKFQVDYLRVDELVALGRSPYTNWWGQLGTSDREILLKAMAQMGVADLSDKFFAELSDGQKQKVLIARALTQMPRLLILDEPTTYLDIPSKRELIQLLKQIAKLQNVAIVLSTHDLDLIETDADIVWLMGKDGSFTTGSPENLASSGLFKKHFYF